MFIDKKRIDIEGGKGGQGAISFALNKKPSGGDGGTGGRVYLEGTTHKYDYSFLHDVKKLKAGDGFAGGRERSKGANGEDVVIKVPLVTQVKDIKGKLICEVTKPGEKVLIADGGKGGLGNYHFRSQQRTGLRKTVPGRDGQFLQLFFELELQADIGFIGLPNAGKSSMLNALSNANVKVAPYPFTTLNPNLGVAEGIILLDLPGLIEGTVEGKGLGTRFTRHLKRIKLLAHFVSLEAEDPAKDYLLMREEVKSIDTELAGMQEIIVLTKSDTVEKAKISAVRKALLKYNKNIFVTTVLDDNVVKSFLAYLKSFL